MKARVRYGDPRGHEISKEMTESHGRGTVLVVDDEEEICRLLAEILALGDFRVATAQNGREALRLVEQEPPDLIILDLVMPEMDGVETLRRIRAQGNTTRVVILTAQGTAQYAREAMALGVTEFLGKPFHLDRLLTLVAQEVGKAMRGEEQRT